MSSIDQRVVEAKFDNKQFQEGVKSTLSSLDTLKRGLSLDGATRGLENVAQATGRVSHGFSIMRIAAFTAISTITRQAVYAAEHLVAAFTIDPIKEGFQNYETQINAVQTILANTGLKGAKGLQQVNSVLQELNVYANKTVYNFSEMAKNIGTFTAAGVKLKPAADSIKGIANLAAMSGSSSQQASTAMYQLSQAIAANQVKLQDWNSVVNAGIGGKVFQKALFSTAEALHTIKGVKVGETFDQWTKSGHTFRQSLQEGWINAKVLTTTLREFTGDMSKAQLKAIGFNAQQIKDIQEQGKTAVDAATKIKTFTQLGQALKEEVGTAYASIFKTLFGDINQAKSALSALHTTLENALTGPIYAINGVLQEWSKLGGRTAAIDAFKAAWKDLGAIIKPIHDAFREIFPATTGKELYNITVAVRNFFQNFKMGASTADGLKRTFAGLFAVLDIGWQVIKSVAHFLGDLLGAAGKGTGGILQFTGSIGDFLVALDQALKKGQFLNKFMDGLAAAIKPVIVFIQRLASALFGVFNNVHPSQATNNIAKALNPIGAFGKALSIILGHVVDLMTHLITLGEAVGHAVGHAFAGLGPALTDAFASINYTDVLHTINTALFAGLVLLIKKFVDHFRSGSGNPLKGFADSIKEPFEQMTGTLQQMQKTLRAATLLEIAAAVGILAASAVSLSRIDAASLTKALTALGGMFAELLGSTLIFTKIGGAKGLIGTAAGLVVFATALRILTSSVVKLSGLGWDQLAKGLTGVAALIGVLTLASRGLSGQAGGMIRTGASLLILAAAIRVLVGAVTDLSKLSWGDLAKGLVGVGGLLVGLTLFSKFSEANKLGLARGAGLVLLATGIKILASAATDFGKLSWGSILKGLVSIGALLAEFTIFSKTVGNPLTLLASSAALIGIGAAMDILAGAMNKFGKMSWGGIAKGLVSMAGALTLIVLAMNAMPPTSILSAAALVGVSIALLAIGEALKSMGGMSWGEIAKGLVALAGSLTIIAIAMEAMMTALPGAAALLVVTAALALFVPELKAMGGMSWGAIAKSLIVLAGAFVVLGVASALLTPLIPSLLGLGAAILVIGVGVAAAGAGVLMFATGLTALSVAGAAGSAAIVTIVAGLLGLIPTLAKELGLAIAALATALGNSGAAITKALATLLDAMLNAVHKEAPKLIDTFAEVLMKIMTKLDDDAPKIANKFADLMVKMLDVARKHAGPIINAFTNLVVTILNHLTDRTDDFVRAAGNWIVAIIHGLDKNLQRIITAGTDLVIHFIKGMGQADIRIVNAAAQTLIAFLHGLAGAIKTYEPQIMAAGWDIAKAIAEGFWNGLKSGLGGMFGKVAHIFGGVPKIAFQVLEAHSPSRVFERLGRYVDEGFALGIVGGRKGVVDSWTQVHDMLKTVIDQSKKDITDYAAKLKAAEKAHDETKIKKYTAALAEARKELRVSTSALDSLNKQHDHEEEHLKRLGKRYDEYSAKIDNANQKLHDAIQVRNDYKSSIRDEFNVLPDISETTNLQDYTQQTEQSIADLQTFIDTLAKLRKKGLSDAMYKELLSKGTAALPLAEEILAGGKNSIDQVNQMSSQLASEAKSLASTASTQLYQAGVDSAQGLVDGLRKKRAAIAKEMRGIAHDLVVELKKELKIKSPSQVFDELGRFTGSGLAQGLRKSVPEVQKATSHLGRNTIDTMKKSIREMNDLMSAQTDLQPTITPVLDLSTMKKQAAGIGDALASKQLLLGTAYSAAANASAGYQANQAPTAPPEATPAPGDITFVQNNNSPKALTSAEIYRQTNNQLSRAKGVLTSVTPTSQRDK